MSRRAPEPRDPQPPSEPALDWDIVTSPSLLNEHALAARLALADAARAGDWREVLKALRREKSLVNAARPGGSSGFTPLHQAAYRGAPPKVVKALLAMGAWRLLRATSGELPVDVALRCGHQGLIPLLTPEIRAPIEPDDLRRMEIYFHAVINGRAERLVREHKLRLPLLEPLQEMPMRGVWMPVPGMYGGFHYWLRRGAPDPLLVAESWCRVVDGSGERHEITPRGIALVDEGFV